MKQEYVLNVNGFEMRVVYDDQTVSEIFIPLLKEWTKLRQEKNGRVVVFLSAPPGVGKTTMAEFMEYLSKTEDGIEEIQAIGLDGFHYHQDYILAHTVCVNGKTVPMKEVKGCPETFDINKLIQKLNLLKEGDVKWPIYDRNLHDVVEDAVTVTKDIVLIEGNWLLSTEGLWEQLVTWCDDSVFVYAGDNILKERLIQRKMRGGLSREEAERFYHRSDKVNVNRLLENHHTARINLEMQEDGSYIIAN